MMSVGFQIPSWDQEGQARSAGVVVQRRAASLWMFAKRSFISIGALRGYL